MPALTEWHGFFGKMDMASTTSVPQPGLTGARDQDLEQYCIDTVRVLSVDAVEKANSGHPGTPMGIAPMGHVLWSEIMRYNPRNPNWPNRDRFILSAGHACM